MKKELVDLLISPKSRRSFSIKDQIIEGDDIKSGILFDDNGNEYKITDYVPRFVKDLNSSQTLESFSYKWKRFFQSALNKQEQNKTMFLDHYGWSLSEFKNFVKGRKNVLDAGCGIGYITNWVASESEANVYGIDISFSIENAYVNFAHKKQPNLHFLQADLGELPFREGFFDFIICKEVIHHTPEPRKNFSKLVSMLAPGGVILIYVYKKKGPVREFCDDFLRSYTTKLSVDDCYKFAEAMTEFGKSLREAKVNVEITKDIPFLNIKAGSYDLQRLLYWNMFKCWWDDEGDKEYSNAVNFDWYHPEYAFRYTEDEIKNWFKEENVKIENLNILDAGIAVRGTKIK